MDLIKDIVTVLKLDKPLILQRDFYDIPRYYLAFLYFVILLITNWIGYLQWYTVMLVGFIIPFVYILTGNKLNSYWQYLAILLWFRTYCSFLQSLDVIQNLIYRVFLFYYYGIQASK